MVISCVTAVVAGVFLRQVIDGDGVIRGDTTSVGGRFPQGHAVIDPFNVRFKDTSRVTEEMSGLALCLVLDLWFHHELWDSCNGGCVIREDTEGVLLMYFQGNDKLVIFQYLRHVLC